MITSNTVNSFTQYLSRNYFSENNTQTKFELNIVTPINRMNTVTKGRNFNFQESAIFIWYLIIPQ